MKKKHALLTILFNYQKNQPLPKVTDQAAYYDRQLCMYNLVICVGHQMKENVLLYHWDKIQQEKEET